MAPQPLSGELTAKLDAIRASLGSMDSALVAYSGGVDSSLVAFLAAEVLGTEALAVTSGSASLKRSDLSLAKRLADEWGMRHRVIVTDELSKPDYRANPVNRCFHCKTSLYTALADIARQEGFAEILNGTNTDDLGDHRPGLIAAEDFAVRSPLVEAGVDKAGVRALAAHLGLDNAAKPQSACLSSRFPYGASINAERLAQVEQAEERLARLGFVEFRVRHHEDVARLEIGAGELERALELRDTLQAEIQACGYRFVALDLGAFRSGSLNEGIINTVNIE
ncbi:MAG: ATP-dependent sacrificial sulfur transferase LarE [Gammaproteobacteria bacterium]|nr:ATP-dependent sacrificial sulfur transferase LarE [Gammaproteobacteria bacterium]